MTLTPVKKGLFYFIIKSNVASHSRPNRYHTVITEGALSTKKETGNDIELHTNCFNHKYIISDQ